MRRGRFFDDRDRLGHEPVVVIDDVMARQAFGDQDPLGRHVWIGLGTDSHRVVGIVGHVRYWGLAGDDDAGVAVGTLAAAAAARLLVRAVEGVRPPETSTFAIVIALLVSSALLASLVPARRASRQDAMTALRQE